jgi:hypothetical protein
VPYPVLPTGLLSSGPVATLPTSAGLVDIALFSGTNWYECVSGQPTVNAANGSVTFASETINGGSTNNSSAGWNGNGAGLTNLNAGNVASGILGSNYLQACFSNYAVHCAGVPTVTANIGTNPAPIYTGGSITSRGGSDFAGYATITNGSSAGGNVIGTMFCNFTPQFPFSTNVRCAITAGWNAAYGEINPATSPAFFRCLASNNVSSAGVVTNFTFFWGPGMAAIASTNVLGVVFTVSGQ